MPPRRAPQEGEAGAGGRQRRRIDDAPDRRLTRAGIPPLPPPDAPLDFLHAPAERLLTALSLDERPHALRKICGHMHLLPYDARIESRVRALGLLHIAHLTPCMLDSSLVQGLCEFWRPETHTFHFTFGEMTPTLEDVKYLYGLPVCGIPVSGTTQGDMQDMVVEDLTGPDVHPEEWWRNNKYDIFKT